MKKQFLFLSVFLLTCLYTNAQNFPTGMNYQAVARDHSGQVIADKVIHLEVTLYDGAATMNSEISKKEESTSTPEASYVEVHEITTNSFGMFSLTVGQGKASSGDFALVPWSSSEIWMAVAIDQNGDDDFVTISDSKLLAVPYAIHALTASDITGKESGTSRGGGGKPWYVGGNDFYGSTTGPTPPGGGTYRLGSIFADDIVFITDNIDRMTITANGEVQIAGNLVVDSTGTLSNLVVENNVEIGGNTTIGGLTMIEGMTRIFNDFGVTETTTLGNTLDVSGATLLRDQLDVEGATNINNTFGATGATTLGNTLDVAGATNIGGATNINNTLGVSGATTLGGTLDVAGATSFSGNTSFGNELDVAGAATFGSTVDVTGATNIGGATNINNTFGATGATTLGNTLDVAGATTIGGATNINNTLNVSSATTIGGVTTINNTFTVGSTSTNRTTSLNGQVTIDASLPGGSQENYADYPLRVKGGDHGVAIQVNGTTPNRNTNWLTLFDGAGNPMGRIEGFQGLQGIARNIIIGILAEPSEAATEDIDQNKNQAPAAAPPSVAQYFNNDYAVGALAETLDLVNGIVKLATNVIACFVGIGIAGDCDDAIWSAVDVLCQSVQLGGYIAYNELNLGATFESGGADYAEWLEKEQPHEIISFGEVVGVKGGLISREFTDAERYMVVSNNPTVLGAMPDEERTYAYEIVAFMGQVPVKVIGEVQRGDYILPSGNGDGLAIAIHSEDMKAMDFKRIIGIAWSESDGKELFEYITVAIGINANDMAGMIDRMQGVMNEMQRAIQEINPDYNPAYFDVTGNNPVANNSSSSFSTGPSMQDLAAAQLGLTAEMSKEKAFRTIQEYTTQQNVNLSEYPYISELLANPDDVELAQATLEHYTAAMTQLQGIMKEVSRQN